MHNNGDDNDVSERCFSFDLSQTRVRWDDCAVLGQEH